jgi:sugar phosphate permease
MADRRRWTVLAVGTFAQAASCCFVYGVPMLVPALRSAGLTLVQAGVVVSAPMVGLLLTLILWGAAADRHGERVVLCSGVALAAVLLVACAVVPGTLLLAVGLVLAGAAGASVFAASGRVVMGWFPASERGLAMGTRQTSQPLGVALAAFGLPGLARAHGVHLALLYPAVLCLAAAVLVLALVADPPRPAPVAGAAAVRSPYRASRVLLRVHLSSALLVVPQFAVATFTLVYLVGQRHWDAVAAGRLIVGFQVAGAAGRVVAGVWSDRVRSRLVPMRQLAVASAVLMLVIAVGAATSSWVVVLGFAVGAVVTVADNGLAFTAVAELAGREWSGRALGVQNTGQNLAAVATSPALAAVIGETRYALAFGLVAACPLLALALIPVRAEAGRRAPEAAAVAAVPGA